MECRNVDFICSSVQPYLRIEAQEIECVGLHIPVFSFAEDVVRDLFTRTIEVLKEQSTFLDLDTDIYVVGDIHGNIHDLLKIFCKVEFFESRRWLFLGDYIDRGEYSFEVIILLFSLLCKHPGRFFLLRGNHECELGEEASLELRNQIKNLYDSDELFGMLHNVFSYLPIAASVGSSILCIHGGLGPNFVSVDQIKEIERPIRDISAYPAVVDILWSDPACANMEYAPSPRGMGCLFGQRAVDSFLERNQIGMIIRGHQCTKHGVIYGSRRKVLTVFSSSCYSKESNYGAFIHIDDDCRVRAMKIEPNQHVARSKAKFDLLSVPPTTLLPPLRARPPLVYHNSLDLICPSRMKGTIFRKPRRNSLYRPAHSQLGGSSPALSVLSLDSEN